MPLYSTDPVVQWPVVVQSVAYKGAFPGSIPSTVKIVVPPQAIHFTFGGNGELIFFIQGFSNPAGFFNLFQGFSNPQGFSIVSLAQYYEDFLVDFSNMFFIFKIFEIFF